MAKKRTDLKYSDDNPFTSLLNQIAPLQQTEEGKKLEATLLALERLTQDLEPHAPDLTKHLRSEMRGWALHLADASRLGDVQSAMSRKMLQLIQAATAQGLATKRAGGSPAPRTGESHEQPRELAQPGPRGA